MYILIERQKLALDMYKNLCHHNDGMCCTDHAPSRLVRPGSRLKIWIEHWPNDAYIVKYDQSTSVWVITKQAMDVEGFENDSDLPDAEP